MLERLSWKRLVLELVLCCIPALILSRLRKALEHSGHDRMVQTVRGTGYRFSTRF